MSDAVANALAAGEEGLNYPRSRAGLAGAGGGMMSMALTYPLATVSTRSQVSKTERISQIKAFQKILKEEGPKGLYSGINSAMFGIAITQYVYYYWYEFVKAGLEKGLAADRALTIGENMLTGAIAGAATAVLTNPIWVINTRMVVKKDSLDDEGKVVKSKSAVQTAFQILKEEGILGFFKGIFPALILVINPVIQFTVFERLKGYMERKKTVLSGADFFLLGAVSKLCATAITYPYIVVKSRMQLKDSADASQRYSSVADGLRKIIAAEGVKGLYKGIEAKLVQSVLASAFTFAFKEQLLSSAVWILVLFKLRAGKVEA
ncbi:hypothetical protein HK104_010246 [Borealophlyctis nickersoniae]|nr:hypothetical protein HK104_010246 [Borealophlyctis nickersoniae]